MYSGVQGSAAHTYHVDQAGDGLHAGLVLGVDALPGKLCMASWPEEQAGPEAVCTASSGQGPADPCMQSAVMVLCFAREIAVPCKHAGFHVFHSQAFPLGKKT